MVPADQRTSAVLRKTVNFRRKLIEKGTAASMVGREKGITSHPSLLKYELSDYFISERPLQNSSKHNL